MKVLHDLDLNLLCRLKNTLLEDTGATAPSSYSSYSGLTNSNVGLICHHDGRIWYYGKPTSGSAAWYSSASSADVPTYSDPNRVIVTDGSNLPIASAQFGVSSNNLDLGVSGTKRRIVNLNDPVGDYDAANKRYVDSMAAGLRDFKDSCVFATVAATGGTFSSVPAQATITGATITNFDSPGVTVTVGMRVLVKDQAGVDKEQNGIYEVTAVNAYTYDLQRTLDANETGELSDGTVVFVEKGTAWDKTTWIITDSGTAPVIDTDDINWVLFSQVAGIVAGSGLTMTGATIDVNPDNVTIYVTSDQVAVKPATVDARVLLTATANTNASWGQLPLGSSSGYVTGTLNTVNGGLGSNLSSVAKGAVLWFSAVGTISSLAPSFGVGTSLKGLLFNDSTDTVAWTDTTGTGLLVLGTSPTITTSIITGSASFDVFNTTATTINAFGAATTINVGNVATGAQTVNMFGASTGASTYNFAGGATANTTTKAINIGAGGVSGSVTNVTIGSSTAGATGTFRVYPITVFEKQVTIETGASGLTLVDPTDNTKVLNFNTASIATGTTRTLTVQNSNGTIAIDANHLGFFAATTSAQLAGVISDETGSGVLVFGTSPAFTTSVTTGSSSFDVFNTTATTVNAFGAATTLAIGNVATAAQTVNMFGGSTGASTYNFACGATTNGTTKTINIGTGGVSGSVTNINLGSSTAGATGTITVNLGLSTRDGASGFTIFNAANATKKAQFSCASITTATTRTYTFADASGTVALLAVHHLGQFAATTSAQLASVISDETGTGGLVFDTSPTFTTSVLTDSSAFDVFNTTATQIQAFGAATTLAIGNTTTAAQTVHFCTSSTGAIILNLATGVTATATTKTINIGTGGASGSTTNINFGSATGGASGTAAFQNITLTATSPMFATSVRTGSTSFDVFNTTATTINFGGAATTLNIGNVATAAQTVSMFGASTGASTYSIACGATANATTKTINLGTGGVSGSVTTINIGSSTSGATGTTNFKTAVVVNDGNTGNFFGIANVADSTKKIAFSAASITTATTRTLTVQNASGTIAYLSNHLGQFGVTTSTQLAGIISDETGTGLLVFATSPTFTTSVIGGASFDVFNTVSTTINAFGAATTLTIGGAAGAQTVTIGGSSTAASTYNFGTGTTGSSITKTVNIGTGGAAGSTTNINIGSSTGGSGGTITLNHPTVATILTVYDSTFSLKDSADTTKVAKFECGSITTGTTRTYTLQNTTGTLALLSNTLNQFGATTSAQLASIMIDKTGTAGLLVFNDTPALITPKITTGIDDVNSALMIAFTATASAVNYLTMTNSASTAAKVYLGTAGSDANISLQHEPKATTATPSAWGAVTWKDSATNSSLQVLRMCRTWGFTLSTGATDRANNALTLSTSMTISHEFGTQDIMVMITEVSTGALVMTDWVKTSGQETRQVTLSFKTTPASGAYRVTVVG